MNRRQALLGLGAGALELLVRRRPVLGQTPPAPSPKEQLKDLSRLDHLAEEIRLASKAGAFDVCAAAIHAGAEPSTLIGAAFLTGVQEIRPRSVGGKLHAVMMVESSFQLIEHLSPRDRWLAALWTVNDCKVSQRRDERDENDWKLPPRPQVTFGSLEQAHREWQAAFDSWDAERADRAVVGLLSLVDPTHIFELLWPVAARSYTDIGHKIIFCTQVERALRRIGSEHAETALRSLVNGLLYEDSKGRQMGSFDLAQQRLAKMPAGWLEGKEDPGESLGLLHRLRDTNCEQAQDLVLEAFRSGLGPATVWDGLRLYAAELFHRRPASAARRHGPVHPVTEVNAFHYAWRTTQQEPTRRLMILQAAGWLPLLRRDLQGFFGKMEGSGVDVLGTSVTEPAPLEAIFEQPSAELARAHLDRDPSTANAADAYLAGLRQLLMSRANQSHQYKFLAALQEESKSVHPRWATTLLAPAVTYLPMVGDQPTETFRRSERVLRRVGFG